MSINDLAEYLKLSTFRLYKPCAEGQVPGRKGAILQVYFVLEDGDVANHF
ncbi:MAG: hypothetical protein K8T91_14705 [Planctomycetes bacterium]|nr:hypothetical protein [Planctomycetota bacterium]